MNKALIGLWMDGGHLTDGELHDVGVFFATMLEGVRKLGTRYELVAESLQREQAQAHAYMRGRGML